MFDLEQRTRTREDVIQSIQRDYTDHADTIAAFHRAWYGSEQSWRMTSFEDVPMLKNPMDMWVYQEIIWHLKPTLIIETGTAFGGSALFYARQLDKLGQGAVVTIDIEAHHTLPKHPRITYVPGSSVDPEIVGAVAACARTHPRVMVVLDSDHSAIHVAAELEAYAPLVTAWQFLVVEDTNLNGRPLAIDWKGGPGPGPAVDAFLDAHSEFLRDPVAERYLLTMHPGGWLRRRA